MVLALLFQNLVVSKQEIKTCLLLLHLKDKTIGNTLLGLHLPITVCASLWRAVFLISALWSLCFVGIHASYGLHEVLANFHSRMLNPFAMLILAAQGRGDGGSSS